MYVGEPFDATVAILPAQTVVGLGPLLIGRAPGVLRLERLETRPALVRAARPNGPSTEEVTHRERQLPERPHGPDLGAPRRQREGAAKKRDHKRGCQECRVENGHRSEGAESF